MPAQISLAVVGVDYPNRGRKRGPARRFIMDLCQAGDPVELRPEPDNPKDPQAIAVYSERGEQMGYLPAERAPYVGMMMRRGEVTAIFQEKTKWGGAVRIAFDGDTPVLPRRPESQVPVDDDWWPDEMPDYDLR